MEIQKTPSILIVDDQQQYIDQLKSVLESSYQSKNVIGTTSLSEVDEILKRENIEVVFLDLDMSESQDAISENASGQPINGAIWLERYFTNNCTGPKVCVYTRYAEPDDMENLLFLGATHIMLKGTDSELKTRLRSFFNKIKEN